MILLPCAGFAEPDYAPQRQPGFRDVPSSQLAPGEDRPDKLASRNRDRRSAFAVEQAHHDSRSGLADWRCLKEVSSRAAVSKSGLLIDYDRTIGDFKHKFECFIRVDGMATAINRQTCVENCSTLRQRGNSLAQFIHR